MRYDNFLGAYNVLSVLRYNSMFALIALGMCFVIMTGGIDLSVGSVAAMASVVSTLLSPPGLTPALLAAPPGAAVGLVNGVLVTRLGILPFIATLATMLAASGTGLLLAGKQSVSVSTRRPSSSWARRPFGLPARLIAGLAYVIGSNPPEPRLRPLRAPRSAAARTRRGWMGLPRSSGGEALVPHAERHARRDRRASSSPRSSAPGSHLTEGVELGLMRDRLGDRSAARCSPAGWARSARPSPARSCSA